MTLDNMTFACNLWANSVVIIKSFVAESAAEAEVEAHSAEEKVDAEVEAKLYFFFVGYHGFLFPFFSLKKIAHITLKKKIHTKVYPYVDHPVTL
jgi:hypothetical protein